jgi:hypothetical protein
MPTHHDDLELVIGDEWAILGKLLDENGAPLDLTPQVRLGWTLIGSDGNSIPGLLEVATLEPQSGGMVLITVSDSFTRTLTPARYYDAIRVWVDDAPVTEWTGTILATADPFHPMVETMPPPPDIAPTIEDAPSDGKFYVRRSGAWVELPSGFSTRFEYMFDDRTTPPPLNSQLRFDNVGGALTTKIWVHNNDADGLDVSNLLMLIEQDFIIFVQDKDEPLRKQRFLATGPMVNLGTYCELSVTNVVSGDPLRNNQRCFVMVYGGG